MSIHGCDFPMGEPPHQGSSVSRPTPVSPRKAELERLTQLRFGILHSDGSLSVLVRDATFDQAEHERAFADEGEHDPAHRSRIVVVRLEALSILTPPGQPGRRA
ncbi:MAG: hypothetical protein JSR72_23390 [Proteobacteria bacterium]|nr:hypothetical protein [Pseudomonadota bacterium]